MTADEVELHPSDGWVVMPFETAQAFESWMDSHVDRPGLWVKLAKKGRGIASVTYPETVEVALCFGWVDSKMHGYDDDYYLLRFQPRRPRSNWAGPNKSLAERLITEDRMRQGGLAQVAAAKADGRWDAP